MSNTQYISIPLKAHVKKYAIWHLGNTPDYASKKNIVGLMVYASLDPVSPDWRPDNNDETLELKVYRPNSPVTARGLVITTKKVKLLEDMLDSMFMNELFSYILIKQLEQGWNKRKSMRKFLQKYNITEQEMPLQTLVKRVYRSEKVLETA